VACVNLLYFARVREALGLEEERRNLPDSVRTVRDLMAWLVGLDTRYAEAFAAPEKLRCAIDQVVAPFDALLEGAREIAFFPPVTGG
jgi:molybdopterin synthase sulfur carrier subunit